MVKKCASLFIVLLLSACQDFGGPMGGGIGGGQPQLSPQEQRLQGIETKLGDVQRKVDNLNFAAQSQGIGRLEQEVRELRGQVEQLRNDVEQNNKRSRELYTDLDRRVAALENASRAAHLSIAPQIATPPPVPANQEEESTYLAVFDRLKAGKYDDAINGFKDQLTRWPDGKYADNAWYWMGQSYYSKRDHDAALASFRALIEKFPQSPKASEAMVKIGTIQLDKKQKDDARATFQRVIKEYPDTDSANVAKQRLEQIK